MAHNAFKMLNIKLIRNVLKQNIMIIAKTIIDPLSDYGEFLDIYNLLDDKEKEILDDKYFEEHINQKFNIIEELKKTRDIMNPDKMKTFDKIREMIARQPYTMKVFFDGYETDIVIGTEDEINDNVNSEDENYKKRIILESYRNIRDYTGSETDDIKVIVVFGDLGFSVICPLKEYLVMYPEKIFDIMETYYADFYKLRSDELVNDILREFYTIMTAIDDALSKYRFLYKKYPNNLYKDIDNYYLYTHLDEFTEILPKFYVKRVLEMVLSDDYLTQLPPYDENKLFIKEINRKTVQKFSNKFINTYGESNADKHMIFDKDTLYGFCIDNLIIVDTNLTREDYDEAFEMFEEELDNAKKKYYEKHYDLMKVCELKFGDKIPEDLDIAYMPKNDKKFILHTINKDAPPKKKMHIVDTEKIEYFSKITESDELVGLESILAYLDDKPTKVNQITFGFEKSIITNAYVKETNNEGIFGYTKLFGANPKYNMKTKKFKYSNNEDMINYDRACKTGVFAFNMEKLVNYDVFYMLVNFLAIKEKYNIKIMLVDFY